MKGWTPDVAYTHEYDDDGRLVRSIQHTEPEWDDEQVEMLTAYEAYRASIGPHGQPMQLALDPASDPTNYEGHHYFVGEEPVVDWAEKARLDKRESWEKEHPNANRHGLIFGVRLVDRKAQLNSD